MDTPIEQFDIPQDLAQAVLEVLKETPEGASEVTLLLAFELRGHNPETFYGIITRLEQAGLVRWRRNLLFRAWLN